MGLGDTMPPLGAPCGDTGLLPELELGGEAIPRRPNGLGRPGQRAGGTRP